MGSFVVVQKENFMSLEEVLGREGGRAAESTLSIWMPPCSEAYAGCRQSYTARTSHVVRSWNHIRLKSCNLDCMLSPAKHT